jgi:thiol-disulfide isomerase/thioredoxin
MILNMLYYVMYTLSVSLVWGFLLQDIGYLGHTGIFLGLLYSFYSPYLIKKLVEKETNTYTFIKFSLPLAHLLITLFQIPYDSIFVLLNPVIIGFILFLSAHFDKRQFPKYEVQFFLIFFVYLYSFSLVENLWQYYTAIAERKKYNFELKEEKLKVLDNKVATLNLSHYNFLNQSLDTIKINPSGKYTIIETWNEKCPPCMRAIPEMRTFYKEIKDKATNYYIYIPAGKNKKLNSKKVFAFDKISDKEKILVDINLQEDTKLEEYPVFLVFDKKGNRQLLYKGYKKGELQQKILDIIK